MEEMKEVYEARLNNERQTALRLKGDSNIMKKRLSSLQKDIDDHKEVWLAFSWLFGLANHF